MQLKDAPAGPMGLGNAVTLIPIQHRMSSLSCGNGYGVAELHASAGLTYTQRGWDLSIPGGEQVHNLRNEGDVEARTIAVQLIPADAARRIDVADPGNCHLRRGRVD